MALLYYIYFYIFNFNLAYININLIIMWLIYIVLVSALQFSTYCALPISPIKDIFFAKSFQLVLINQSGQVNVTQINFTFGTWQFKSTSNPSSDNVAFGMQTMDIQERSQTQSFSIEQVVVSQTYFTANLWTLHRWGIIGPSVTIRCLFVDYQAASFDYPELQSYFIIQQQSFVINQLSSYQKNISLKPGSAGLTGNNFQFIMFITALVNQDTEGGYYLYIQDMFCSVSNNSFFQFNINRNNQDLQKLTIKFVIVDIQKINSVGNFFIRIDNNLAISNINTNPSMNDNQAYWLQGKTRNALIGLYKMNCSKISFQTIWNSTYEENLQIISTLISGSFQFTFNYIMVEKNRCNQILNLINYPFYYPATGLCYKKCPISTYLNTQNYVCEDCNISKCAQCRNTSVCLRCQSLDYRVNPNNLSQCIKICKDDTCLSCQTNNSTYCLICDTNLGKTSQNGICVFTCGDGIKGPNEQCDDNNTINNDGCSNMCEVQQFFQCFSVQNLSNNLFTSKCIFTKQVYMEVQIIKKIRFSNKIQIQFLINKYWSSYQSLITNNIIKKAFQFKFAINTDTLQFKVSLNQYLSLAKYQKAYTPSSTTQLLLQSSNNHYMYLYPDNQNRLAQEIQTISYVLCATCLFLFVCGYVYGKSIVVDLIITVQLIFTLISTTTKLSPAYSGLVLQGVIDLLGINLSQKNKIIYESESLNLKGVELSLQISNNLNFMILLVIIPFVSFFAVMILRCFWKNRQNILKKISQKLIGQFSLYGLFYCSVIGNVSTAIVLKAIFTNNSIILSPNDVAVLLLFNVFQIFYFGLLYSKPAYFGQFIKQMLKLDNAKYFYNFLLILVFLNTYAVVLSLESFLQKYVCLLPCFTFTILAIYLHFKRPFIHANTNDRSCLTYFVSSFICFGIFLQNVLQHSLLYHYWPLIIGLLILFMEVYNGIFIFVFIKRGVQLLINYQTQYHQFSKTEYLQLQNRQFQKRYFANMPQETSKLNINMLNRSKIINKEFEWQNYSVLANERYKSQRRDYFKLDQSAKYSSQSEDENISQSKQGQYDYQQPHKVEQRKQLTKVQQINQESYKKKINQALKGYLNSQNQNQTQL